VVLPSTDCTTNWGTIVTNGSSITGYQYASVVSPSTCAAASETQLCTNGTLSPNNYNYGSCTETTSTCSTTVSGKANNKNDTIVVNDGTTNHSCTVANSKNYTCPSVTTSTSGTVTVTSSGTVNLTNTITPICGAKTVNF
jgi:transcription elongation factor